jgi:gas vesicle protein
LYLYKDSVKNAYNNTAEDVQEEMVDVKDEIDDMKEDAVENFEDIKDEINN